MDFFKELDDKQKCPCGSGEVYGNCCKKKNFQFGIEGKRLKKLMKLDEDVVNLFDKLKKEFFDYYGREPGNNDFVFSFSPIYNDKELIQAVDLFRGLGFSEEKIYAYYKSGGLFPCELNIDLLSETELEEFRELCDEYRALMNEDISTGSNVVQFVLGANSFIEEKVEYAIQALIHTFNDFIHRHSKTNNIREYKIKSEIDYCIFSALKTIKTLESLSKLKEEHLTECIYSLSRSIFENYMYICNINMDSALFKEKLLPKVDNEKYMFDTYADGRINYNRVIDRLSGGTKPIKVVISDLKRKLPYETDHDLYEFFYQKACQFVHVDVMSAKSYFAVYDPYDEINPSLIACLITAILATLLLIQISKNRNIQALYGNDAQNLCKKLNSNFTTCLEIAKCDLEHSNILFDVLLQRLKKESEYDIE